MEVDEVSWQRLLRAQDAVVTRRQALDLGWTDDGVRHRLRRGRWQVLTRGVLLTASGTPTPRQRLRAGLLLGGPLAMLTSSTACRAYGLANLPDDRRVHVVVPASVRRTGRDGYALHPTTRPTDGQLLNGLRTVTPPRAVVDACLQLRSLTAVRGLLAEAVQQQRTTLDELDDELARAPRRGSGLCRQALGEVSDGARSAPEAALLAAVRRCRDLPAHAWNADVHDSQGRWLARPDLVFAGLRLVVEVDGRRWHWSPERQDADLVRHTRLEAAGWTVLRFPAARVLADPDGVLTEVLAVARRLAG